MPIGGGGNCCCNCYWGGVAIIVCNSNQITDDNMAATLNTNGLGTIDLGPSECVEGDGEPTCEPLGYCPGTWWSTDGGYDTGPTLADIDYVSNAIGSCCVSRLPSTPGLIESSWLVHGTNTLTLTTYDNNCCGNEGSVWIVSYWKVGNGDDETHVWKCCILSAGYSMASGPGTHQDFTFTYQGPGTPITDFTGPYGPNAPGMPFMMLDVPVDRPQPKGVFDIVPPALPTPPQVQAQSLSAPGSPPRKRPCGCGKPRTTPAGNADRMKRLRIENRL